MTLGRFIRISLEAAAGKVRMTKDQRKDLLIEILTLYLSSKLPYE